MNPKILILGGSGFVGKALTNYLISNYFPFSSLSSKDINLLNPQSVYQLSKRLNKKTILIFAASINRELGDSTDTFYKNIRMGVHVAEAILKNPPKKCIYLSTADVYGRPKVLPINETSPIEPKTFYAISKYTCESILDLAAQQAKISILILRYNGVFGPGQRNIGYGPNAFIKAILKNKEIQIWGNGQELRDSVYVKDLASIIIQMSLKNISGVYNIATGQSKSFLSMIGMIKKISPKPVTIIRRSRTSTSFNQIFDNSKLLKNLPNVSFTPIQKALEETFTNWN